MAFVFGVGCVLACVGLGCGGSSGGSCDTVAACGGDIVGTWKVRDSCIDGLSGQSISGLGNTCPSASAHVSNVTVTGTMTFKADKTVTSSGMIAETVDVTLPASCLTQQGVTITCDQLNQVSKSVNVSGSDAGVSAPALNCHNASGGGCTCSESVTVPFMSAQTYSTSGTTLTLQGSSTRTEDYCVQGNTLYVQSKMSTTMTMGGMSTNAIVGGRTVLEKQ
jgi:hypothetical protein